MSPSQIRNLSFNHYRASVLELTSWQQYLIDFIDALGSELGGTR